MATIETFSDMVAHLYRNSRFHMRDYWEYVEMTEAVGDWRKRMVNSASYKYGYERGKADYGRITLKAGPQFRATIYEMNGWRDGWQFAHEEAMRRDNRNLWIMFYE